MPHKHRRKVDTIYEQEESLMFADEYVDAMLAGKYC